MTDPADRQVPSLVLSASMLGRRCYGSLDPIIDSERRALRSIGATAYQVEVQTGKLLNGLMTLSGVRIFQGYPPRQPARRAFRTP